VLAPGVGEYTVSMSLPDMIDFERVPKILVDDERVTEVEDVQDEPDWSNKFTVKVKSKLQDGFDVLEITVIDERE
jgi:hypothetical protein